MMRAKTETVVMNLKSILPVLAAVLVILTAGAKAQQSLGGLVAEAGFDWMIGTWVTTTDQGEKLVVEYKWELEKHLVTVRLKWPRYQYHGIIFYDARKDQVVQIGVDGEGGNGKGIWGPMDDKAVVKYEHTGADWETHRMAVAHSKVDADTMKVEVYGMDSDGRIEDQPRGTMEYKRVKKEAGEKVKSKKVQ